MFLTACYNDAEDIAGKDGYQPSTDAIAFEFNGDEVENATRASGAIYSDDVLATSSISVFASYTGKLRYENTTVKQDFMWNQKVTGTGTAPDITWTYNPVKYWPNGLADTPEYLSFFAYAPYEANPSNDKCITDISDNDLTGDPWVNYRLGKYPWPKDETGADKTPDQVDLLYGTKYTPASGTNPEKWESWTNVSKFKTDGTINTGVAGLEDKVKFTMKHALACIGNEITIKLTDGSTNPSDNLAALIADYSKIVIYGIKIEYKNLTTKARLVLNSADGSANWKEVISGELTTTRTYLNMFDAANVRTFTGKETTAEAKTQHIPYLNGPATATSTAPTDASTQGDGLFYIPMQIAGTEKAKATVTLYYRVNILADDSYIPAAPDYAEASATFELPINDMAGKKQGLALTLTQDYDLMHLVYTLGGTATEPSYSRLTK
jgi:hypothetical protein